MQELNASAALTTDAQVYDRVAEIAAREGRGPLPELPLSSFGRSQQPEAMMGAMRHRLPLVTGDTRYLPPTAGWSTTPPTGFRRPPRSRTWST